MAAFGHISETEVTFLEISAVIVIQVKNTFCELISIFNRRRRHHRHHNQPSIMRFSNIWPLLGN